MALLLGAIVTRDLFSSDPITARTDRSAHLPCVLVGTLKTRYYPSSITRWCKVHDHADGSPEQKLCEKAQVGLKRDLREAIKSEKSRMLTDAQETVEKYGGTTTWNTRTE